jgi:hypothetical protein
MIMVFMAVAAPSFSSTPAMTGTPTETPEARTAKLMERLEEIKAMDRKSMSKAEKKALRKEVRAIKEEMAAISGGVYISVGAILLILLLILLLA